MPAHLKDLQRFMYPLIGQDIEKLLQILSRHSLARRNTQMRKRGSHHLKKCSDSSQMSGPRHKAFDLGKRWYRVMQILWKFVRMVTRNADVQFSQRWVTCNEIDRRLAEVVRMECLKTRKAYNDI